MTLDLKAPAGEAPEASPAGLPSRSRRPWRSRLSRWEAKASPYLYVSPFFLLFALVGLFPLLYTAYVSVHQWSLLGGQGDFTGLENYRRVLKGDLEAGIDKVPAGELFRAISTAEASLKQLAGLEATLSASQMAS